MESENIETDSSGLERAIDESIRHTNEGTGKGAAASKYFPKKSEPDESDGAKEIEISEGKDSPHGSLSFIYHKNQRTGETEYLVEQPQPGKHEAGKIKLVGGHRKVSESHDEAIRRETGEEVSSPAKEILLAGDFVYHTTMTDMVNGKITQTVIYEREIKSDAEWDTVKAAYGAHDAGNLRVFTASTLLSLGNEYIAFGKNWEEMFKNAVIKTSGLDDIVNRQLIKSSPCGEPQFWSYGSSSYFPVKLAIPPLHAF